MVEDLVDPRRSEPAYLLPEREMLEAWLEFHRMTLQLKCDGLSAEQLKARPVSTSALSLHGLVRHMADVELGWFQRCLLRRPEIPYVFHRPDQEDRDFVPLDDADFGTDLAVFLEVCAASRRAAAGKGLNDTGVRQGEEVSLRWIFTHMIEEYARHNGHADLIREQLDGAVGW